jgi:hypothetical protein
MAEALTLAAILSIAVLIVHYSNKQRERDIEEMEAKMERARMLMPLWRKRP